MSVDLARALDDGAIRRATGGGAYARGAEYANHGRVFGIVVDSDTMTIRGQVRGTRRDAYVTQVWLQLGLPGYGGFSASAHVTSCTCPVAVGCKHAAALMLAARRQYAEEHPCDVRAVPTWELHLANLLDSSQHSTEAFTPVALQFELRQPSSQGATRRSLPPRLTIRPVQQGRSGTWVRSGMSWDDLRYAGVHRGFDPDHLELLKDFDRLAQGGYGYRRDPAIDLGNAGRSLWALLDRAREVALPLVTAGARSRPVVIRSEPAAVRLDLTRGAPDADLYLRADVRVGGEPLDLSEVGFIGSPGHGCFILPASDADPPVLVRLDHPLTEPLQRFVEHAGELRIPAADADRFVQGYYPRLRQTAPIGSDDDSVPLPEISGPRLCLTVSYSGVNTVALTWGFAYDVDGTRQRHPLHPSGGGVDLRDPAVERQLLERLELPNEPVPLLISVAGVMRIIPEQRLHGMETVMFTEQLLPRLCEMAEVDVEVEGRAPAFRFADARPEVALSATDTRDADWFDLGVTVTVDGHDVEFARLFAALAAGDTHLVLDSGTYFELDDPVFESLSRLITEARALSDRESEGLRINPFQAGLWEELVELGVVEEQSQRWARTVGGLLDLDKLPEPDPPAGIDADLRPYQLHGYQWLRFLWDHGLGGILADDMGLGKTLQTLALISHARDRGHPTSTGEPFLVVAPTSVVGNWATEARRFAPGLRVVTIDRSERKRATSLAETTSGADLVITSYALFRIDEAHYQSLDWAALVLDEAQFVKNHRAKTYQCARRLVTPFKLAITGTPLENSLMDLWSMLSIVAPGLFPQPKAFADFYSKPIERGDRERLTSLRRRIRPLMLRRTKDQVATELPPKQESVLSVELSARHRRIYETHLQRERQKILGLIDDIDKNRFLILRSLTLLRQLSLDPALVDDTYDTVGSAKIDVLVEHLEEVVSEGHRALVFSQFTGFLRRVRDRLDASGIGYSYLDGRTRKRAEAIDAFKYGDAPVFVISLKAGGFGLNLTEADYCFVLDPWWNPAVEAQAVDRTHRIGQERTVMVYRLVSSDTIETKVMELKARKEKLFTSVMDGDGAFDSALTAADIRGLLGA